MTLSTRRVRIAYLLHGALSLLVVGVLAWATTTSLRLEDAENAEKRASAKRTYEDTVRLAMYRMETRANAMLAGEFQLDSSDYVPFYYPDADEMRIRTGEMLPPGFIVKLSKRLLHPSENAWVLLDFQASPRNGYRSPQIVPEAARHWPAFEPAGDVAERERYADTLAALEYAYTVDELAHEYEKAEQPHGAALSPDGCGTQARRGQRASPAKLREYQSRKQSTAIAQHAQTPPSECVPEQLAEQNVLAAAPPEETLFENEAVSTGEVVGVTHRAMHPVWLKLRNRPGPDLAFLRAIDTGSEVAIQGFIVDWPRFRDDLLGTVRDLFPRATLEALAPPAPRAGELNESVLTLMPARLIPNAEPLVGSAARWSTSRTALVVGWTASLVMLIALGVGIRSLVTLSERRSQFAYAITHELRTPLTTFRLYTDMLAQGLVADDSRQEYLNTLNQESQRLADLVSGVLEYSRIENNSVPINREAVSIGVVFEAVREAYAPRCANAGVALRIEERDLADTVVETDRQHVVQIIGNLIDNACKYGRGEPEPRVTVSAARTEDAVFLEVADNGPGIPPRLRAKVFKPYKRGATDSTPATGGIGLGLALSRSWAKLLGGQLELLPRLRGATGARFRFTLPTSANGGGAG